ncbi:MAG: RNA polymerase sigma factor [Chloroflexota bacterium]
MVVISATQDEPMGAVVAQAASGDEAAFARIVEAHHPDMRRVAYLVCDDPSLAEEAVAEAWAIAWRKLGSVRDPARLRPWLVSVAANEARQLVRSRHRRTVREVPIDAAPEPPMMDQRDPDLDLDLARALGQLSPDDRALLSLRYVAGLNATELARVTGRSASGTRVRLMRLLERLRRELGAEGPDR